ncbi:MAG: hypothetical protein R3B09_17790 [Nannocystaceae bacterium]
MSTTSPRAWASITIVLLLLACGGASSTPATAPRAEGDKAAPDAATPSSAPVVDDRQAVVQLILDHPGLDGYWHQDTLPDRAPLVVLANQHTRGLTLTKFDEPVQIRSAKELAGRPYFVVHALKLRADGAEVRFEYAVEGVRASATLDRGGEGGGWQVTQLDLGER